MFGKMISFIDIIATVIVGIFIFAFMIFSTSFTKVKVHDDINEYNKYIGLEAEGEYFFKWGMNESDIFPGEITLNMDVKDFKVAYYNILDAEFLSYLVVDYDNDSYKNEVQRLKEYKSDEYVGYFGATGFSKYTLLAMNADEDRGFIYAITDDANEIIYVGLEFTDYFYAMDYEKYINPDYLPDGFDATSGNPYQKKKFAE